MIGFFQDRRNSSENEDDEEGETIGPMLPSQNVRTIIREISGSKIQVAAAAGQVLKNGVF